MNTDIFQRDPMPAPPVMTVSELNRAVARTLERSFPLLWVAGEVSNFTKAASGHWYFSLKDREAQVRCVMFKGRNQGLDWLPREGDHVEARATVGLYAARGDFQLGVENLRRAGAGSLFEAFTKLKAKLEAEGLFDAARKRPLPLHPRTIGVVTSLQAAALRDVLSTLARRAPHVRVIVYPAPVQGRDAAERLVMAVKRAAARAECDVLLLVRGGGSIEDLWSFNDEALARALVAMPYPVVSGVGHETDFTIADFAADVRAPTPTAAAELAAPDRAQLLAVLRAGRVTLTRRMRRHLADGEQSLDELQRRLKSPAQRWRDASLRVAGLAARLARAERADLAAAAQQLNYLSTALRRSRPQTAPHAQGVARAAQRLSDGTRRGLEARSARIALAAARLDLLDPLAALERGYAIVTDAAGAVVRDTAGLAIDEVVGLRVARGSAEARVQSITPEDRAKG